MERPLHRLSASGEAVRLTSEASMRKYTLVVFPDEVRAFQGFHGLMELHRSRCVNVYGAALVERDENGALVVRRRSHEVPLGSGLGALVGGASSELLSFVARELTPGTFALVAEFREERVTPVDVDLAVLGGRVVCEWWRGAPDDALERRTRRNAQLAARRAEARVAIPGARRRG
jgi:hypothetical protein